MEGAIGEADQVAGLCADGDTPRDVHVLTCGVRSAAADAGPFAVELVSRRLPVGQVRVLDHGDSATLGVAAVQVEPQSTRDRESVEDLIRVFGIGRDVTLEIHVPGAHPLGRGTQNRCRAVQAQVARAVDRADELPVGRVVDQFPDRLAHFGERHVIAVGSRRQGALGVQVPIDRLLQFGNQLRADHPAHHAEAVTLQAGKRFRVIARLEVVPVTGNCRHGRIVPGAAGAAQPATRSRPERVVRPGRNASRAMSMKRNEAPQINEMEQNSAQSAAQKAP